MNLNNGKVIEGVGVVIASTNRPEMLKQTILSLASRGTLPEATVISLAKEGDCPQDIDTLGLPAKVVYSETASSGSQRNTGLVALPPTIRFVIFLDDDMEIHDMCMEEVRGIFERNPNLAAFSGCLLANGDITRSDARQRLDKHIIPEGMPDYGLLPREWSGLYGCCMCMRKNLVEKEPFDENLPLYAIGEDTEIGFRLRKFGNVGGSARCPVVHLACGSGRISEVGVGYAQIINFLYFVKKRIGLPRWKTLWERLVGIPLTNLAYTLFPTFDRRSGIDRAGRLKGNFLALRDLAMLKIDPRRLATHILRCRL